MVVNRVLGASLSFVKDVLAAWYLWVKSLIKFLFFGRGVNFDPNYFK